MCLAGGKTKFQEPQTCQALHSGSQRTRQTESYHLPERGFRVPMPPLDPRSESWGAVFRTPHQWLYASSPLSLTATFPTPKWLLASSMLIMIYSALFLTLPGRIQAGLTWCLGQRSPWPAFLQGMGLWWGDKEQMVRGIARLQLRLRTIDTGALGLW